MLSPTQHMAYVRTPLLRLQYIDYLLAFIDSSNHSIDLNLSLQELAKGVKLLRDPPQGSLGIAFYTINVHHQTPIFHLQGFALLSAAPPC